MSLLENFEANGEVLAGSKLPKATKFVNKLSKEIPKELQQKFSKEGMFKEYPKKVPNQISTQFNREVLISNY